jgi:cellulose synthase/poly-beta-1,6-N-acetylglucosamine synthase-like glycosyltransferase
LNGTTVIIPSYEAQATLPLVLEALAPQVVGEGREVVLVDSTGADDGTPIRRQWPWVRVVAVPDRMLPGRARNLGASLAHGELLAFLDADAVPQTGWLDELERALVPEVEMVAGAVLDGTPDEPWGTAAYMLEFLEWVPERRSPLRHAAGCNLLIRRSTFERAGGFPEDLWPAEDTIFSVPFAARGTLDFAPRAQVRHLNRTRRREVLAHQRRLGASWVHACARVSLPGRRLATSALAPVAVVGRMWSMVRQLSRQPGSFRRMARHGPLVAAGLVAWGAGMLRPSRAVRDQRAEISRIACESEDPAPEGRIAVRG